MAKRRDTRYLTDASGCMTCGAARPREDTGRLLWPANAPFVHCAGSSVAYLGPDPPEIPHHGHVVYPDCWSCHGAMGCDQCAGVPREVLCTRCCVWLFPIGLAHHGPILNDPIMLARRKGNLAPPVSVYPERHQRLYRATAKESEITYTTVAELIAMVKSIP